MIIYRRLIKVKRVIWGEQRRRKKIPQNLVPTVFFFLQIKVLDNLQKAAKGQIVVWKVIGRQKGGQKKNPRT